MCHRFAAHLGNIFDRYRLCFDINNRLQFYSIFKINTNLKINTYKTYIFRLVLPQEMAQVITWTASFTGSSRICPQNLDLPFFWSTCSSCTYHCMALSVNSSSVTSHWWMWICMFSILFRLVIYSVIIIQSDYLLNARPDLNHRKHQQMILLRSMSTWSLFNFSAF